MADHKDQRLDPLEEDDPTVIPLTKKSMAEKSLAGSQKESKPELYSDVEEMMDEFVEEMYSDYSSSDDEEMMDQFVEESKKPKLDQLKRRAFYSVLLAFRVESLSLGNKRTQIVEKLMREWSIAQETRLSFEDNIQKNLVAHKQRVASDAKIQAAKPPTIRLPAKKLTYAAATPRLSWGEALIGRRVLVRMPGEDEFEDLLIKEFNAKEGMHRLATVDPNVMWMDEALSWMDVRKIPAEDIKWRNGEKPDF